MMQLIVMCISLYPRRTQNPILNFLFWLLVIMPPLILINGGFLINELKGNPQFGDFMILIDACLVPLICAFLLKIIIPDYIDVRKTLLLVTPTVIFAFLYAVTSRRIIYSLSLAYTTLIFVIAFVMIIYISLRYDNHLKNNFSNIENKTVSWVRNIIFIFAAWYLIWRLVYIPDNRWIDSVYFLFQIIIWIFIYHYSIKHVTAFSMQELFETSSNEENLELQQKEPIYDKLEARLNIYMNEQHPWLNPTLTLQDLAIALHTNRTYLSEYFNKKLNTTFYDYLNGIRVNHACQILRSEPNLSIIQIGERSGFHSLSTFRRAFEKHKSCTPAEYRNRK